MIKPNLSSNFYETYREIWSKTERRELERLDTANKIKNLSTLLNGIKPRSILDYGCGLGDALHLLANRFKVTDATGVDISSTMIGAARREHPECTFVHGGIEVVEGRKLDLITFIDVLEHLEDIPAVLTIAKRSATYIAIKIPLEKTWLIALLNVLRLKQPRSLAYESEGHLYEFNRGEIEAILSKTGLMTIRAQHRFVMEREFLFSDLVGRRMKNKTGLIGKLNYCLYLLLKRLPYSVTTSILRPYMGDDLYLVCKEREQGC
jgi:ubiquinone/menaquinone biosynthesis C-methylase UbiE